MSRAKNPGSGLVPIFSIKLLLPKLGHGQNIGCLGWSTLLQVEKLSCNQQKIASMNEAGPEVVIECLIHVLQMGINVFIARLSLAPSCGL